MTTLTTIIVVVTAFLLGWWLGYRSGKSDGQQEMLAENQRIEATRIWAETMAPYLGGKYGKAEN
jgi:hypothetical protein